MAESLPEQFIDSGALRTLTRTLNVNVATNAIFLARFCAGLLITRVFALVAYVLGSILAMKNSLVISADSIQEKICRIRGKKVMLSHHLASLYDVPHKALVQAVKRNLKRFPGDFMFQLNEEEFRSLRSQFVTLEMGRGRYPKYRPYAFTEQGVAMLSAVLRSNRAIQVSIEIVRVFVKLREIVLNNQSLVRRINEIETKFDGQFKIVFQAIRELIGPGAVPPKRRIGFLPKRA